MRRCSVIAVEYAPPAPASARRQHGIAGGPQALVAAGLEAALRAAGLAVTRLVRIGAPSPDPPVSLPGVAARVAHEVRCAIQSGHLALILGDCTASVGAVAGLAGTVGPDVALLWLDAHGDFNTPETSRSGYFGGMPLAVIAGRGPAWWQRGAGAGLPLPERCAVLVGTRDLDPQEREAIASSAMEVFEPSLFRSPAAREQALSRIGSHVQRASGLYFHLDVDVLDPELFPWVTFPVPGGLVPGDLFALAAACRGSRPVALTVTAFDPSVACSAQGARELVSWVGRLAGILAGSG